LHISVISFFSLVSWAERKLETEMVKVWVLHYWSTTYLLLSMKLLWLVYCLSTHVVKIVRILPLSSWQMCVDLSPSKCNALLRVYMCQECFCECSLKKNSILGIQKFGLPELLVTDHGSSFPSTQNYDNLFCLIAESH